LANFWEGFILQAGLILALGAQNVFVLESGLKKNRHILVASICTFCDVVLIGIGVAGAARFFALYPQMKQTVGMLGIAFLVHYAITKLREKHHVAVEEEGHGPKRGAIAGALAFSLLNPHVYLDTQVLIGGYATKITEVNGRYMFGAGAAVFSAIWFYTLAIGASKMNRFFSDVKTRRTISICTGIVLLILAVKFGDDLFNWFGPHQASSGYTF
jgi:L-lysine exporter family protein LysE/ArgO